LEYFQFPHSLEAVLEDEFRLPSLLLTGIWKNNPSLSSPGHNVELMFPMPVDLDGNNVDREYKCIKKD
jgi:hypothetical protein